MNSERDLSNVQLFVLGVGIIVLMIGTAAAAVYITHESQPAKAQASVVAPAPVVHHHVASNAPVHRCNDSNIVGTLAGGAAGGILGAQIGHGSGKTAATIGGVLAGGYAGNQLIPTQNLTCRE